MTQAPAPLDPLALFRALHARGVEYVVIGGFSLAAHGVVRGTKDVDVFPDPDPKNLERLAEALGDLEARVHGMDDFAPDEFPAQLDADGLGAGGNWVLSTVHGRLDVMQYVAGVKGWDQLREGAVAYEIPGLDHAPLFAGLDDLVAMKRAAGRDQDLLDIVELERARGALD
ncbi:MAG: hypothetical protein QOE65_2187 [Solirubrobacteraceae bacterium]|jgi:hypothetical protein|nr:hypothetical protein [Solirubrobacteraceae bacterium]